VRTGGMTQRSFLLANSKVRLLPDFICRVSDQIPAPIDCYIMQGEQPLPESVISKYAKTGGELCKNVFLMG
jgi:hypothetical protein